MFDIDAAHHTPLFLLSQIEPDALDQPVVLCQRVGAGPGASASSPAQSFPLPLAGLILF